jgi:porin
MRSLRSFLPLIVGAVVALSAQPASAMQMDGAGEGGERYSLLGDLGGLRPWLGQYGASLALSETSEYLSNLRGGLKTGGAYDGVTAATLDVDTQPAFGFSGGTFNVSALQIHGRNLTTHNLGTLDAASTIEAQATTRLWELWYQQTLMSNRVSVKVGQQSIEQEFMVNQDAGLFVNSAFGWPTLPSYDMPSGGPAYPLAALGARVSAQLTPTITALAGVFDGDPIGNNADNVSGTNFNLHNGALAIGEVQYERNQLHGLPGTYKLGVWYNDNRFADQRLDDTGLSLADMNSTGIAQEHHGDWSIYAVADQLIWRPDPDGPRSLGVFARLMGAPGDRNLISLSANAGIVLHAPFRGRADDTAGIGVSYTRVGSHARQYDQDVLASFGAPYAVRTSETMFEATYSYQVRRWWSIQADAQYTVNAGAGQNPDDPMEALRNTVVVGIRTNITI